MQTVNPGQTITLALLGQFSGIQRQERWYVSDDAIQNSVLADDTTPDGWAVAYDAASQTFTVTVSSDPAFAGRTMHVGVNTTLAAPGNTYNLSQSFQLVGTAPPPSSPSVAVPTLSATPVLRNNVPAFQLGGA